MENTKRAYFRNLDACRFFCFIFVFLEHLPLAENPSIQFFQKSGGIALVFFFVLSGFLITYLLLLEKQKTQTISLKNFFMRRILRVWPLYYLMVAFAYSSPYLLKLFGLPSSSEGYEPNLLSSLLFCENYKMMFTNSFPNGAPLRVMWSICMEEHFYILWGLFLFWCPIKRVPQLILWCIILAHIVRVLYHKNGIPDLDVFSHFDYFAFGAIPAYLLVFKPQLLKKLEMIPSFFSFLTPLITVLIMVLIPHFDFKLMGFLSPIFIGVLFTFNIALLIRGNTIAISNNHLFSRLGTYSYGLYLFHTVFILLVMRLLGQQDFYSWGLLAFISFVSTILLSGISYHYLELPFLRLKRFF